LSIFLAGINLKFMSWLSGKSVFPKEGQKN
jgi:hypothetical protein